MFDHSAIFVFSGDDEDTVLEALIMADVDVTDIECEDDMTTVFAPHTEYNKAKQALIDTLGNDKGEFEFEVDEIQFIPQNTHPVTGDDAIMFETFLDMLTDLDDVQNVYHNADLN
jgi:transcriptional/translational regulatory protein YebC/TACO1